MDPLNEHTILKFQKMLTLHETANEWCLMVKSNPMFLDVLFYSGKTMDLHDSPWTRPAVQVLAENASAQGVALEADPPYEIEI